MTAPKSFAKGTSVSAEKSKAELDRLLSKHGAAARMFGEDEGAGVAVCVFRLAERQIRLRVPIPTVGELEKTEKKKPRDWPWMGDERRRAWLAVRRDQVARERWRALLLITKAKLEIVALGLSTVEREFLADLFLPDGRTLHEVLAPQIAASYLDGRMPPLLGAGGADE